MVKRRSRRLWSMVTGIVIFVLLVGVSGLYWISHSQEKEEKPPATSEQSPERPGTEPTDKETLTLYFSDKEAMYLEPETRTVSKNGRTAAELAVLELIKGPADPNHSIVIPRETRLLGVQVKDGVAYVDFSKELKTKHWGGSAGELMTIFSVTNTLTELKGIEKVQFLIEGKKVETLAGHFGLKEPISRDESLIRK